MLVTLANIIKRERLISSELENLLRFFKGILSVVAGQSELELSEGGLRVVPCTTV